MARHDEAGGYAGNVKSDDGNDSQGGQQGRRRLKSPPAPPEVGREGHNNPTPIEKLRQTARPLNHVQLEADTQGHKSLEDKHPPKSDQCGCQTRAPQTEKPATSGKAQQGRETRRMPQGPAFLSG
jgi:hypothetical protein